MGVCVCVCVFFVFCFFTASQLILFVFDLLQGNNIKIGSERHYENNSAQQNRRPGEERPNEDYVQMGAHGVFQLGIVAEHPRFVLVVWAKCGCYFVSCGPGWKLLTQVIEEKI